MNFIKRSLIKIAIMAAIMIAAFAGGILHLIH